MIARVYEGKRPNLKAELLIHDPHCHACGKRLTYESGKENSAKVVAMRLACPAHQKLVKGAASFGEDRVTVDLTEKGKAYLDTHRPLTQLREAFVVDGQAFERYEDAETRAIELAQLLGTKIEILVGLVNSNRFKVSQIVRPGDGARCREESYHRERRATIDVSRIKPR